MTHLHTNPALYEGTVSLWPMVIVAAILWIVVLTTTKEKK